ncbi:bifunctional glutamine synthetase adenylyltransferase/deadenyltransferase, partial [Enterobacter cloacae complex sp.6722794]
IDDQQTQTLPDDALNQARLIWGMGFTSWSEFYQQLSAMMTSVHQIFAEQIGSDDEEDRAEECDEAYITLWQSELSKEELASYLPSKDEFVAEKMI